MMPIPSRPTRAQLQRERADLNRQIQRLRAQRNHINGLLASPTYAPEPA